MVVHEGSELPYPVLTNSTYSSLVKAIKSAGSTDRANTFNDNSIERFANACSMVKQYKQSEIKKPLVDYSFDILNRVSSGNFTKWSIVYDITNKKVHFKTLDNKQVKSFDLNGFDYACTVKAMSFNMNQSFGGNINNKFSSYSADANSKMLNKAFNESKGSIDVPDHLKKGIVAVAEDVKCS